MNSFRVTVFDPALIIGQILCLQSIFYCTETFLIFLCSINNYYPSLDDVFSLQIQKPISIVQLLSVLFCSLIMPLIIERAKQCLDFACTIHIIHIVISSFYNRSFSFYPSWYLFQLFSIFICTVVGEYFCMKQEILEIPLTFKSSKIVEA